MKSKKPPKRGRTARRRAQRDADKLSALKERLFSLEVGGAPERPLNVSSASVIEPHAQTMRCPRCDGEVRVLEHAAHTIDEARVRQVRTLCKACGAVRSVWFRIQPDALN